MPIAEASFKIRFSLPRVSGNTTGINAIAVRKVANIPNCAAAPKKIIVGSLSRGEKSIIAPTPMKMSTGNNSFAIPASKSTLKKPGASGVPIAEGIMVSSTGGRFASIQPKPMGSRSVGSYSFLIAR